MNNIRSINLTVRRVDDAQALLLVDLSGCRPGAFTSTITKRIFATFSENNGRRREKTLI